MEACVGAHGHDGQGMMGGRGRGVESAHAMDINARSFAMGRIVLAFLFGYAFTFVPLMRSGLALRTALRLALASDTISITVMEIVDNAIMLVIPGAMDAGLDAWLFWGSLAFSLVVAGIAAFPVNRWLIARGRGHAVVHQYHRSSASER